jgi:hypothetical protein
MQHAPHLSAAPLITNQPSINSPLSRYYFPFILDTPLFTRLHRWRRHRTLRPPATFRSCGIRSTPLTRASSKMYPYIDLSSVLLLTSKLSIVLVPGIGTISPENWPFADRNWLATLPGSGSGARILAYGYASPFPDTKFPWESILMLGYDFLQCLGDARSELDARLVSS